MMSIDAGTIAMCERAAADAGLRLGERELAILCRATPHVRDMLERVRGAATCEPASVFRTCRA
jgi:hypothetical protein